MNEQASSRPVPVPDEATQPFFDAAAQGKLLIKYCAACNRHLAPQSDYCDRCLTNEIAWKEASGRGTLYSFIIDHQAGHPGSAALSPYNVIIVELEEGPRLTSNYLGPNEDLEVGMALQVAFEAAGEVVVPKWKRYFPEA